jgi:serine/threonine-protein kinase
MGTPLYMSPEQINESKVDHRADLYSMGVAFYHLVASHPPFRAESALALAYKHLNEEPPSLKQLRPDLPNKFIEIIHRLLAKKPDQRFPDAKSVLASLRQINLEAPNTEDESVDEPAPSAGWRALLDVPKKTLVAFAVTCVVVYLLAAGIGRDLRRSDPLNAAESSSATSPNK